MPKHTTSAFLRGPIEKRQRQVRHELGDGSQSRNSDTVDQQVLVSALSHRDNGRGVVAENLAELAVPNWSS